MKKDLFDFLNIMKQFTKLLKDSLYFNAYYDELMGEDIEDENAYEEKKRLMKLFAWNVK